MGCFLACFGSSKSRKRHRHHRHRVQPRDQRHGGFKPVQSAVSLSQNNSELPNDPVSDVRVKPEEQLSQSPRKKVTFDSNVTTYEHVSVEESTEFAVEKEDGVKRKENLAKQSQSQSLSEDSSVTSSLGSYPSNHRYQNCRDSDDELDYEESDIEIDDDDDDEDDEDGVLEYDDTYENDANFGASSKISVTKEGQPFTEDVKPNPNARDRSGYVLSVLNPVENLSQWKAVKAKGTPPLKQYKENLTQEPRISFTSMPSFEELSFDFKAKSDHQSKKSNQEIAVDASLSNWLSSSENTPIKKTNSTPETSNISMGSNSLKSFEDRPILGVLTMEEIKQFSATSSPRKSPSRSPDEMPIIGTVGTYWNHSGSSKDSRLTSSFKGIANTTSKYTEDKRVNWHSTTFETRLERALNGRTVH